MNDIRITYKGLYLNQQTNEYVRVKQYMYAESGDERFLLLRFENIGRNPVRGLTVSVSQYDAAGKILHTERFSCDGYNVGRKGKFALKEKIPLDEYCADFKVEIVSVNFGKFKYGSEGYNKGLSFSDGKQNSAAGKGVSYEKKERKVKIAPITATIVALLLAAIAAISALVVINFKKDKSDFILNYVNYAFENDDDSEESNVIVTGYRGRASKVVIPDYIEKHKVISIQSEAFKGKKTLNNIVIKGDPKIEARAFHSCSNLTTVDLGGVTTIGDRAFYSCERLAEVKSESLTEIGASAFSNCSKLRSFSLSHDGDVVIKSNAFEYCSLLDNVDIDCFINYKKSGDKFFASCGIIDSFRIKNFNYSEKGVIGGGKLNILFSGKEKDERNGAGDITIDFLDGIVSGMCEGMPVTSFTVKNTDLTEIGASAFKDCKKLHSVSLPNSILKIGTQAFYSTALQSIDLSKTQELGEQAFYDCKNLDTDLNGNAVLTTIDKEVFYGCENLKTVYIPSSLESIGESAFYGATGLTELKNFLSSGVNSVGACAFTDCSSLTSFACTGAMTAINDSTFEGCSSLNSFTVGNGVKTVGKRAFAGCSSLGDIDFRNAENLTSFGESAFEGCSSLEKFRSPFMGETIGSTSASYLFGSNNSLKLVELTGKIDLSRGDEFKGCDSLKELIIPYVTTATGMFGVAGESEIAIPLEKVTLTETKSIGENAFANCYKLREINYPDTVTSIGAFAFLNCLKLEKIILPKGLNSIGENAFLRCYKLNDVFNKSEYFKDKVKRGGDTCGGVGYYAIKVYTQESDAPKTIESGDYKLMYDEDNKRWLYINYYGSEANLTFPTGLTDNSGKVIESYGINDYLLFGESKIAQVEFGKINYIGVGAFYECSSLTNFSAAESTAESIGAATFYGCENLKSFNMPSVKSVGANAFNECHRLESVTLSANSIGDDAFTKCFRLYEVKNAGSLTLTAGSNDYGGIANYALGVYSNINDGLKTHTNNDVVYKSGDGNTWYVTDYTGSATANIGAFSSVNDIIIADYAFYKNENLNGVIADSAVKGFYANSFFGCEKTLETLDLTGASIETIPSGSLKGFTSLKTVCLPDALTSIDKGVLSGCTAIEKLSAPHIGSEDKSVYYLFNDGSYSYSVPALKEITVTKITSVCDSCFKSLSFLEKVTLPSDVTSIGESAFSGCSSLKDVNLGDTKVSTIGTSAFSGCEKLTSVSFPSTVTSIERYAFNECVGLKSANLANTKITTIANNAFAGCTSLEKVTLPNGVTSIGQYAFSGCHQLTSFDFNGAMVNTIGESAFNGCALLKSINLHNSVTTIGANAFWSSGITNLVLPSSVTSIGKYAFESCTSLVSVTVNGNVLGEGVFSGCYALTSVSLNGSLTAIPESAFNNCSSLNSITLPNSLKTIGGYAFSGCSSFKKITLPSGLTSIGASAFYGCKNLREVFSSSLSLTKGSDKNGQVAKYAVAINETLTYYEVGNFKFAGYGDNWFLYDYNGYIGGSPITLPENFIVGGKKINSYTINGYAFESEVQGIVLPTSVTAVEENAFKSVGTVYFKHTTEDAVKKISGYGYLYTGYTNAYLYAKCAHGDGMHWTYDGSGYVTLNSDMTYVPRKEPTETENGNVEYWYCGHCKKYYVYNDWHKLTEIELEYTVLPKK